LLIALSSAVLKLPLSFEPNQGQTDPRVKFLARGAGYGVFLTADQAVLTLSSDKNSAAVRMQDLRDWVRYRNVVTGREGVAYTGLPGANPAGPRLDAIRADAMRNNQSIVTLPILPRLPTSGTLFRGRPL
jgi:hypothetical protein